MTRDHGLDGDPHPQLPRDTRSQVLGRIGEAAVSQTFERQGWLTVVNRAQTDFGIDLAIFKKANDGSVLPYALSVQVKTVAKAKEDRTGAISVRVAATTVASWMWSTTPTICALHEESTGRIWWSNPLTSYRGHFEKSAKTRNLRITRCLESDEDWSELERTAAGLWSNHAGAAALADSPLILQVLTDVAMETDLWTSFGGTAPSIHHAAAIHAYRTVAGLNALAGRTTSDEFVSLGASREDQMTPVWVEGLVTRNGETLGMMYHSEIRPRSEYLVDVFGHCGREFSAAIPRLRDVARLPELGIPREIRLMLNSLSPLQLKIINPDTAATIEPDELTQLDEHRNGQFPLEPEINNRVQRAVARVTLSPVRSLMN